MDASFQPGSKKRRKFLTSPPQVLNSVAMGLAALPPFCDGRTES